MFRGFIERAISNEVKQVVPVVQQAANVATREVTRSVANAVGHEKLANRAAEQSNHFKTKLEAELKALNQEGNSPEEVEGTLLSTRIVEFGPPLESIEQLSSTVSTLEANAATIPAAQNVRTAIYGQANQLANDLGVEAQNCATLLRLGSILKVLQAPADHIQAVTDKMGAFLDQQEAIQLPQIATQALTHLRGELEANL